LVFGLCGPAGARDEKADPVGTWKCEYAIGDQKRMSTLTIKKDGDKLAGTMSWPDQKEAKLKDVHLKDGNLTFAAERELMDTKFTIAYQLMLAGDKFKGRLAVEFGGEKREFDIAGCRFVERLLTVVQTRRLQGRPVLDYLYEALVAHRAGLPAPKLI
jgi:hypothetical protein